MSAPADFERLYDDHAQALFGFLLNFIRNEADTRDLLQELFVKVAGHPELLANVRDQRAFLVRLAHNLAVDLIRRRGTRERNYERLAEETSGLPRRLVRGFGRTARRTARRGAPQALGRAYVRANRERA